MPIDWFYTLKDARIPVKDAAHYDKSDKAFGLYFKGIQTIFVDKNPEIPIDWLPQRMKRELSAEQLAQLEGSATTSWRTASSSC